MYDVTLNGVIAQIEAGKIVLPAMQRPFVWKEDRITKLIDSLLRGFPIGTTLLWKTATVQRFRKFQKDVRSNAGLTKDFDSDNSTERYLVLDGQQRLTSLFVAIKGTYDDKSLYIDVLSGDKGDKDAGDSYWDCRFLTAKDAKSLNTGPSQASEKNGLRRAVFVKFQDLTVLEAARAGIVATQKASELKLDDSERERMTLSYFECATVLAKTNALQVHLVDENATVPKAIEEVLEIFVRVNSGGLVLQKSDLLMSLLDLKWNDIQPEIFRAVEKINENRPFNVTRDDVLKSLLLAIRSETRFDRLIAERGKVEQLAAKLPPLLPVVTGAWISLNIILIDKCKITTERFFRGGHNSLLPFVQYFVVNPSPSPAEERRLVLAIYIALMSGVFAGAEARMGSFARNQILAGLSFPIDRLTRSVNDIYGISSLHALLSRHLDLTLNIAHGGITIDNIQENLQRDHIFPKSLLEKKGVDPEQINHYANFHFLRGKDNLNKSDTPPHLWFKKPGDQPPYSDDDLKERLLTWKMLEKDNFQFLITERTKLIQRKSIELFGLSKKEIDELLASNQT